MKQLEFHGKRILGPRRRSRILAVFDAQRRRAAVAAPLGSPDRGFRGV